MARGGRLGERVAGEATEASEAIRRGELAERGTEGPRRLLAVDRCSCPDLVYHA